MTSPEDQEKKNRDQELTNRDQVQTNRDQGQTNRDQGKTNRDQVQTNHYQGNTNRDIVAEALVLSSSVKGLRDEVSSYRRTINRGKSIFIVLIIFFAAMAYLVVQNRINTNNINKNTAEIAQVLKTDLTISQTNTTRLQRDDKILQEIQSCITPNTTCNNSIKSATPKP